MSEVKEQFDNLVSEGEELIITNRSGIKKAKKWSANVRDWLKENLPDSGLSEDVSMALPSFESTQSGRGLRPVDKKGVQRILGILLRAKKILPVLLSTEEKYEPTSNGITKVFVVHGHDEALKANVARLVERLGLEAVILHEQPNLGRTIIEKFSDHSNVAYALVLLTGDDVGGKVSESKDNQMLRARQNVIFELGYFVGKLGRNKVSAIYQDSVELPSDYQGIVFIPHDDRAAWELLVARELRDAGLPVDLNKI
ncbi:MAG: nucleotide-binding protein [Gammaproteobacteria bacterium]|nr:nucleotide-binding protein [Gammaproteobacteria bacterium]